MCCRVHRCLAVGCLLFFRWLRVTCSRVRFVHITFIGFIDTAGRFFSLSSWRYIFTPWYSVLSATLRSDVLQESPSSARAGLCGAVVLACSDRGLTAVPNLREQVVAVLFVEAELFLHLPFPAPRLPTLAALRAWELQDERLTRPDRARHCHDMKKQLRADRSAAGFPRSG